MATLVGAKRISQLLGISVRRVQQLVGDGLLTPAGSGKPFKFDEAAAVQQYIAYWKDRAEGRNVEGTDEGRKIRADADWKTARARMAEIELEELEGTMHSAEDVRDVITDLALTIRALLLALPGRVAVDAASASSAAEVSTIISNEVNGILNTLSRYQYDPQVFRQKVMERASLEAIAEADDDE